MLALFVAAVAIAAAGIATAPTADSLARSLTQQIEVAAVAALCIHDAAHAPMTRHRSTFATHAVSIQNFVPVAPDLGPAAVTSAGTSVQYSVHRVAP